MRWRQFGKAFGSLRSFFATQRLDPFPFAKSLRGYKRSWFWLDARAGLNVALLAIPQGMAYALLAGVPNLAQGILCSAIAALLAAFFCGARHVILGPTNATALMMAGVLASGSLAGSAEPYRMLPVLVVLTGVMLIAGAGLRLADLIQYISRSVVVGYITGAAVLIMAGQLREAMGLKLPKGVEPARTFLGQLQDVFASFQTLDLWTCGVSALTMLVYFLVRKYQPKLPAFAIALVAGCLAAAFVQKAGGGQGMKFLKAYAAAEMLPVWPDFTKRSVWEATGRLFAPAMALAFLAALEMSVMAKSLAGKNGENTDSHQDMFGIGMANVGSAFFSGMAASGSLTRSALNFESGAKTRLAGLWSALLCGLGGLLLGNVVAWVPRCALAVLVICIAISLINRRNIRICLKATSQDAATLALTLLATLLLPLHVAIFVGVATSVVLYLRQASRPSLVEYEFSDSGDLQEKQLQAPRQNPQISIVHVEGELFFGAAELFRTQIQRTAVDPMLRVIILRMKNARHLDATSVMALEELITFLRRQGRHLIISGAMKNVYRVLRNAGMLEVIGRENIFLGSPNNPNLSTRNALKRATKLLGTTQADIRIFVDPSRPVE
jgi:sulfate permease, SulP family